MAAFLTSVRRWAWLLNRRRLHRRAIARQPDYRSWCERYDRLDEAAAQALRGRARPGPALPAVAVLMPLANATAAALAATMASLQAQWHGRWQLCLVGEGDPAAAVWADAAVAGEPRAVRVSAAVAATWWAWADAGDIWLPHALWLLAGAAARQPSARLVYADHDALDGRGGRCDPAFKCDWNPELLLSHDCIGSAALWKEPPWQTAALSSVSTPVQAGAHDRLLRASAGLTPAQAVHLPYVLLHRRAGSPEADADPGAVDRHLARTGVAGRAEPTPFGVRVRLALPAEPPRVSIVIPSRNGLHLLRRCIASLLQLTDYPQFEVVVVDNGSDDPACLRYLDGLPRQDARIRVRRDGGPFNFAALNNAAVADCSGEMVALLNNDIEVIAGGWLAEMMGWALRPGVGAVGARLLYADGTVQHAGVILGIGGSCGHGLRRLGADDGGYLGRARRLMNLSAVTAACLVVQRRHFLGVGGFDAAHFPVAFNDVDLCLRLQAAGLRTVYTPHAVLVHHELATRGSDSSGERQQRFLRERGAFRERWGGLLERDPAYNPNLTLASEDFGLAEPPRARLLPSQDDQVAPGA